MARCHFKKFLACTTAIVGCACGLAVTPVCAAPQNGVTTSGSAQISSQGTTTTITQSSDRAVIRWDQYNVGSQETVLYQQPGASSMTLNRIQDMNPSQIGGRIEANGQIILMNPNGIIFGENSTVDVSGLIATTGNLDDDRFMAGDTELSVTGSVNLDAAVINRGRITAREAGLVGLVAPHAENSGVIEARLGRVTLAGTDHVMLDLAGDDLIHLDVSGQSGGLVKNSGQITADGGKIVLTAERAKSTLESAIVNTGRLQANTVSTKNGRIFLSVRGRNSSGKASVAVIDHTGQAVATGESGGDIDFLAETIHLADGSLIDVSGRLGGGSVHIGGDYQGGGDLPHARVVLVDGGALLRASATENGDGGQVILWSDEMTSFRGVIESEGGTLGGDGGLVEVSSKNLLDFDGLVSTLALEGEDGLLLLDPTNIEISAAANASVTGASPYTPTADDVVSNLNVTTLQTALAGGNVTVQTRATGSQSGDIMVSSPITWASTRTLTLSAHNDIIVNQSITGRSITFTAGNDVQLNANLIPNASGNGTLTFQTLNNPSVIGVAGGAGTLDLSAADVARITGVWAGISIGNTGNTGGINIGGAVSWASPLTLTTAGNTSITAAQTLAAGKGLTINTTSLDLGANLTGSASADIVIQPNNTSTSIGLGTGAAGTLHLDNAELAFIPATWRTLYFGKTTNTAAMDIRARTWLGTTYFRNGSGVMGINGAQVASAAKNLTFQSGNLDIASTITGTASSTLLITPDVAATTMGIGSGQVGTLNLTNAELANIAGSWNLLQFGSTSMTGAMNIGTYSPTNSFAYYTLSGLMSINGAQTAAAGKNLTLTTNNLAVNAGLTGSTGTLTITPTNTTTTVGLGNTAVGTLNLTNAELAQISGAWNSLVLGRSDSTVAMDVRAYNWLGHTQLLNRGTMSINGAQNMAAGKNLSITASALTVGGALTGTGNLTISPATTAITMGLGAGAAGTLNLDATELSLIGNTWSNVTLGGNSTVAMDVRAASWTNDTTLTWNTGAMTIAGAQTVAAGKNLTLSSSNLNLNAAVSGTGSLFLVPYSASGTMGLGTGAVGTLNLNDTELGQIQDGWSQIVFGRNSASSLFAGAVDVRAKTWSDSVELASNAGTGVTINGAQNMGANNLTINANTLAVGANLTGTGDLTIKPSTVSTTIGIGNASAGTLNLTNAELAFIQSGWNKATFGRVDGTGAMDLRAYTWNLWDTYFTTLSGAITVNGAQTVTNKLVNFTTNNLNVLANLTPSGPTARLEIMPAAVSGTVGIGASAVGTLNLTAAELAFIQDGFSQITFGRLDGTGAMDVRVKTWTDPVTYRSLTGQITVNGAQTMGTNNLTFETTNLNLAAALTGTGDLTIKPSNTSTTVGVGTGSVGTLNLTGAEIAFITNGWSKVFIGRTDNAATMNIAASSFADPAYFLTAGNISLTGTLTSTQTGAGTNLVLVSNGGNLVNAGGGINPGTGRYLAYLTNPALDTYAGLTRPTKRYNKTYAGYDPAVVTETGNVYLYSVAPTLTVTLDNKSRDYGSVNPALTYTTLGLIDGDTAGTALSSATASTVATGLSNVGTYAITGSFASDMGYLLTVVDGTLTIDPAALTLRVADATRKSRTANPPFSYTLSGLKNGDLESVLTGVSFSTAATFDSHPGNYAITASGGIATNYLVGTYIDGNLEVTAANNIPSTLEQRLSFGDLTSGVFDAQTWDFGQEQEAIRRGIPTNEEKIIAFVPDDELKNRKAKEGGPLISITESLRELFGLREDMPL